MARARRAMLLWAHRHRLPHEDLEDCYSQATLEILARAKRGDAPFVSYAHVANALEQRFISRIQDRRRAISGRSPMEAALFRAMPLGDPEYGEVDLVDIRVDIEELILLRHDLRRIAALAGRLTRDQRLVLKSQLAGTVRPADFCARHGWSIEKYRKVAQRARARLLRLLDEAPRAESEPASARLVTAVTRGAHSQIPSGAFPGVPHMGASRTRKQGPTYEHISPPT